MKKLTKMGLMLAAGGSMLATTVNAEIILGNWDNRTEAAGDLTSTFGGSGINPPPPDGSGSHKGVEFTVGDFFQVDDLFVPLSGLNAIDDPSITIRTGGLNGTEIFDFDIFDPAPDSSNLDTVYRMTGTVPVVLLPGVNYFLDLSALGTEGYNWRIAELEAGAPYNPSGAGTFINYLFDGGDGNVVVSTITPNTFELNGTRVADPNPPQVPVPGAALLMGMGLFLVRRKVKA